MELIQEIEVWYIVPAIRKELALAMSNNGLKQVEIAKRLGITKAAVNQYLSGKRGNEIKLRESMKNEIKIAAQNINDSGDSVRNIQNLLNLTRKNKIACQIHGNLDKNFIECNLCFEQPLIKIRR